MAVEVAEAAAILHGVHLAIQSGYSYIVVESNSLNVISYLRLRSPPISEVGLIILDILSLCSSIEVVFQFAPRGANSVVHCLAQFSFNVVDVVVWREVVPP
ncbi:hypothetical protein ACOSP7_027438 [Xanthoceras sorbifolium]